MKAERGGCRQQPGRRAACPSVPAPLLWLITDPQPHVAITGHFHKHGETLSPTLALSPSLRFAPTLAFPRKGHRRHPTLFWPSQTQLQIRPSDTGSKKNLIRKVSEILRL